MKIVCNGFNLYKKFKTSEHIIEKFTELNHPDLSDIEISLTYAILKIGNQISCSGGNYSEIQKLDADLGAIINVSCTNDTIYILNRNGQIFEINISKMNDVVELDLDFLPSDERFLYFVSGDKILVGLTNHGHIYKDWKKSDFTNQFISDIKVGGSHGLILDTRGNIYTFGSGSRGQLGHGTLEDENDPRQVDALAGIPIVAIACGTWHCMVISKEGDVYSWGWNSNGQLGLPTCTNETSEGVSVMASPHVIDVDEPGTNAVKVACGKRHSIVLLDNGKLYGCGFNKYKQLLDVETENIEKMTYLHDFSTEKVTKIKCGPWNSVVCCE